MQTETLRRHEIVIGEYRVLLRMEGELLLPTEHPKIRAFYERLYQNTFAWGKEVLGRALCKEYAELPDTLSKSRFPTTRCNLSMELSYEDDSFAAILCSAVWRGKIEGAFRHVGVWELQSELLLPPREIKCHKEMATIQALFGEKTGKKD